MFIHLLTTCICANLMVNRHNATNKMLMHRCRMDSTLFTLDSDLNMCDYVKVHDVGVPKNRTGRERRLTLGTLGIYTFVRHYTSKKSHSKNVSIGGQCWRYLGCGSKKKITYQMRWSYRSIIIVQDARSQRGCYQDRLMIK
jgi:hypothetical protein